MPIRSAPFCHLVFSFSLLFIMGLDAKAAGSVVQGAMNLNCPQFHVQAMGIPQTSDPKVLRRSFHVCQSAYASYFDPATKTPLWVAHVLQADQQGEETQRTNDFRKDPLIPGPAQPQRSDYERSGTDQGHLAAAQDFAKMGAQAMSESFYYTNIVPQDPQHNREASRYLETMGRMWAKQYGPVYVITGPIYSGTHPQGLPQTVGRSGVRVPSGLFKIFLSPGTGKYLAFMSPNKGITLSESGGKFSAWHKEWSNYRTSISNIEAATGFNFTPKVPQSSFKQQVGPMWTLPRPVSKSR